MPTLIQPYLFFGGRCAEAIEFYKTTLGAQVAMIMRYNESPEPMPADRLSPGYEDKVMHASFTIGESTLMASDGCGGDGDTNFNGFSLSLTLPNEAEAQRVFAALSEGGEVRMPMSKTFWSPCFGMVEDRFGLGWMITVAA